MCIDTMKSLSADYMQTVAIFEQRIADLRAELTTTHNAMQVYRIRRRIASLQTAINDMRHTAYICSHYYDKPRAGQVKQNIRQKTTKKQRFRASGYGNPSPAAVSRRGDSDDAAVSTIRAVLLRRHDAT